MQRTVMLLLGELQKLATKREHLKCVCAMKCMT